MKKDKDLIHLIKLFLGSNGDETASKDLSYFISSLKENDLEDAELFKIAVSWNVNSAFTDNALNKAELENYISELNDSFRINSFRFIKNINGKVPVEAIAKKELMSYVINDSLSFTLENMMEYVSIGICQIEEVQRIKDSKIIKIGDEIKNFGIVTGFKKDKNFAGGMKVFVSEGGEMSISLI